MLHDQSRRAFLQRSAALGVAGLAAPFVTTLAGIGEAAASVSTDYKALVCIFLYGGNDYANTIVPYDQSSYEAYARMRPQIAIPRDELTPMLLNPTQALAGGRQYALAPSLAPLLPMFNAGDMAVMLNLGTLIQPTTKAQYQARNVRLPPKLFSHNDQQSFWQASNPEGATSGWGGRLGDLLQSGNGNATVTCVNAAGNAVFMSGRQAVQYAMSTNGPLALAPRNSLYGSAAASATLNSLITEQRSHLLESEYNRLTKRSLDTYAQVTSAMSAAPTLSTVFPTDNSLADQLKVVARMISSSAQLGAKRQVFFVSLASFDHHDSLAMLQPRLLTRLAGAMRAFNDAMAELGVSDKVTTFTASDFGRTLVSNVDGSDHGWGSMHLVSGGAVNGRRFYGTPPVVADNGPDDVGQGRLLPNIGVDQYAATLASWFGVSAGDLPTVLPNIGNYTTKNLGFV